ncbi:MAG: hypothetical protein ACXVB7_23075 [Ktedonobacteraceae bacterium]
MNNIEVLFRENLADQNQAPFDWDYIMNAAHHAWVMAMLALARLAQMLLSFPSVSLLGCLCRPVS